MSCSIALALPPRTQGGLLDAIVNIVGTSQPSSFVPRKTMEGRNQVLHDAANSSSGDALICGKDVWQCFLPHSDPHPDPIIEAFVPDIFQL